MEKVKDNKFKLFFIGILILLAIPYIVWRTSEYKDLSVLIIDKTVPDKTYREHNRIVFALNHYKYSDGESKAYNPANSYVGFTPLEGDSYEIGDVEGRIREDQDLIYIADSYGVYEEEFFQEKIEGERSEKIYGGLETEEVDAIKSRIYKENTSLVAEFNTFGSPTSSQAKDQITELLGIESTGWIGRYFDDLDIGKNDEIPSWIVKSYENSNKKEWDFSGAGFVLANNKEEVLVLKKDQHFDGRGLEIEFTAKGKDFFDINSVGYYGYWFDIVETKESESYADYKWNLTEEGEEVLDSNDIPKDFPAITKRYANRAPIYYFAGDFADSKRVGSFYSYSWLSDIIAKTYIVRKNDDESFQWTTYMPVMDKVFEEAHKLKNKKLSDKGGVFVEDGLEYKAKVDGDKFYIYEEGVWQEKFLKGVNIGAAKPGYFPGELAITKREYMRWFRQISDMNGDLIRVYTTLEPEFYSALLEHNLKAEEPLYLMQGVWVKEEDKAELMDGYADNGRIKNSFIEDSKDLVDIIHGNARLAEKPGFASGEYYSDVSEYVVGWILGIEWDPYFIQGTNENNPDKTSYEGKYLKTEASPAFEVMMAEVGDAVLEYEAEKYNMTRPLSISNWPTTDMLDHPNEPLEEEDLEEFNMELLGRGASNKTGLFASYHIYPYYPEFMNYEKNTETL